MQDPYFPCGQYGHQIGNALIGINYFIDVSN